MRTKITRSKKLTALFLAVLMLLPFGAEITAHAQALQTDDISAAAQQEAPLVQTPSEDLPAPQSEAPASEDELDPLPDPSDTEPAPQEINPEETTAEPEPAASLPTEGLLGDGTEETVTFIGTEDGLVTPGVEFDAMDGVSATGSITGPLTVEITNIVSSDPSYTYTAGDTAFTPGPEATPPHTYTLTYAAYAPDDPTSPLDDVLRVLTAFDPNAYYPGALTIASNSGAAAGDNTYRLTDALVNTGSIVTAKYTAPTGKVTHNTALVVDIVAYGAQWASTIDSATNASIQQAVKLSDTSYAILLKDGIDGDVTIDFALKFKALTQEQCEQWIDEGALPVTNLTVREYRFNGSSLSDILTDPLNAPQDNEARFFSGGVTLENTDAETITVPHTYLTAVSSLPDLTNFQLSAGGIGALSSNNLHAIAAANVNQDPALMYTLPTVHRDATPLVEFTGIKVYVPDDRLALTAVTNISATTGYGGIQVYDANYYAVWKNWIVGPRESDGGGAYYVISPPAGVRLFNNGTTDMQGALNYGMRLLWALTDTDAPLDYAPNAYTTHQNTTGESGLIYSIPAGTGAEEIKTTQENPKVLTLARQAATATQAYANTRHRDDAPNNNITIGSLQTDQPLTYLSNTWYRANAGSGVNAVTTEYVPVGAPGTTQSYTFPYEIQPLDMTFSDNNQYESGNDQRHTVLERVIYTTADGAEHEAAAGEIAAINNYFSGLPSTAGKVVFSAASQDNRVTDVQVIWTSMGTSYGTLYPLATSQPYHNIWYASRSPKSGMGGALSTVTTLCSYRVTTVHEDGSPILNYEMAQADYAADFDDGAYPGLSSGATWLWWRFKVPACPTVASEQSNNIIYRYSEYADGETQRAAGHFYLDIGSPGERLDHVTNPVITFSTAFSSIGRAMGVNNLTGITEAEGIAFLSGAMTALPALSGWTFTYSTNQRTGAAYTVPEITDPAGAGIQIPLDEGEYFSSLTLSYDGDFDTSHESDADTNTRIYLMKDVMMTALNQNPFTGEALNTTEPYQAAFIQLRGNAHWENCAEDGHPHLETPGVAATYPGAGTTICYPPELGVYFTRQALLSETAAVAMPGGVEQVYQGAGTTGSFRFTIQGGAYPITGNYYQEMTNQYNPFPGSNSLGGYTHYTNGTLPWKDVAEAVYVELIDPEFLPDLANCTLYGETVASGNVTAEIVTVDGKSYIKLAFAQGYKRTRSLRVAYTGAYAANFTNDIYSNYGAWQNAAGIVDIAFVTLPGTTTGRHYPIGEVYLDFTNLLENYDGPNATGYDLDRTNWLIAGNADNSQLSGSTAADTNQLFRYDFQKDGATPYAVDVIKLLTVGATHVPGKNRSDFAFSTLNTIFRSEERENLNALVSITGDTQSIIYDMATYITVPRAGVPVTYKDAALNTQTITSAYSLYLRGAPAVIGDSTALPGNLTFAYTTDANPTAGSSYSTSAPTTPEGWAAVTGIRVVAAELPVDTAINLRLDYRADAKAGVGDISAYSAGTYSYKSGDQGAVVMDGNMPLITWTYTDYIVNTPYGAVFWDTYNEDGVRSTNAGHGETFVAGVTMELLDTDGVTVIDTAVTNASGQFVLKSHKNDAGQSIRITMPTNAGAVVKLTKQSAAAMTANINDSDFNRETNLLALPKLTATGFANISAGLVKLPVINIADQSFTLGAAPTPYLATLTEYFGNNTLPASPVYRLRYDTPTDTGIVSFAPVIAVNNATTKVTPTLNSVGTTTARVWVTNNLGDVVEVMYNITVKTSYSNIEAAKLWVDDSNGRNTRPDSATLQLQRQVAGGNKENVGSAVTVRAPWTHTFSQQPDYREDGAKYIYSVLETDVDGNYTVSYSADGLSATNTLKTITVSGVKTWNEIGTGFVRPGSITVTLCQDDVKMTGAAYTKTITAATAENPTDTTWGYSFDSLLEYNPATGQKYVYTIVEDELPADSNYNGETHGMDVTNMYPAKLYFTVTKVWAHGGLPIALRPETAEIALYRDGALFTGELTTKGGATPGKVILNGSETPAWTYTFEVAQPDAEGHVFSFVETPIPGYSTVMGQIVVDENNDTLASCTITNTYTPLPVTYNPGVTKAINGTLPLDAPALDFTFTLTAQTAGQPMPAGATDQSVTANVAGAGGVSFGNITFTEAGTYTYTITETDKSSLEAYKGYTFDTATYTLTVTVNDPAGNGVLAATPSLTRTDDAGSTADATLPLTITNPYSPLPAAYSLGVNKEISGDPAVLSETFRFTLAADGAAPLPAGEGHKTSVSGAGYGAFGAITFTQPGIYRYTITETSPADADKVEGYTYNDTPVVITITVTDAGGQLIASADKENADIVIRNTFTTPVITIVGSKTWEGDFGGTYPTATINLWQNNEEPMEGDVPYKTCEIQNGARAYRFVGVPKYDESGEEIRYTVTETPITGVRVTRAENGRDFTNTKLVPATAELGVTKALSGELLPAPAEFSFTLARTDGGGADAVQMPASLSLTTGAITSGSAAAVQFGSLTFYEAGVYTFTITETPTGIPGMVDAAAQTVEVTVTEANNTLSAVVTAPETGGELTFTNVYTPSPADAQVLLVRKAISGDVPQEDEIFTFRMTAVGYTAPAGSSAAMTTAEMPMPVGSVDGVREIEQKGAGNISFGTHTYTQAGVYVYTVAEIAGASDDYAYDTLVYTITDTVTDNAGALTSARVITVPGNPSNQAEVVFTNAYTHPTGALSISKTVSGEGADTAKEFTFTVTLDDTTLSGTFGDVTFENGVAFFTLKHGESKTATGLPAGVGYAVAESDNDGYTVTVNNGTESSAAGAILAEETVAAAFNNHKPADPAPDPVAVILTAAKTLDGAAPGSRVFTFHLKDAEENIIGTKQNSHDGTVTFDTLSFNEPGTHTYTLVEAEGSDTTIQYDQAVYTITITIDIAADGKTLAASAAYLKDGEEYSGAPAFANSTIPVIPGERISVFVYKVWRGADANRPASVTVQLYREGVAYGDPVTLSANNDWAYAWNDLEGGFRWAVDELNVPAGYKKTVAGGNNSFTITNTKTTPTDPGDETTHLTVNKIWRDGRSSKRPAQVWVQLYRDGKAYGDPVSLSAGNVWTYTWSNLDRAYKWTVDEAGVPAGYTKTIYSSGVSHTIVNERPIDSIPRTGDETNTGLLVALMALSLSGMGVTGLLLGRSRRRKAEGK